ncbi:MAG: Do family serine endopeptidase [Acidobacteria bacterium]|nr:Do family serine endopeptidase [Acidobacteriota bacterium]
MNRFFSKGLAIFTLVLVSVGAGVLLSMELDLTPVTQAQQATSSLNTQGYDVPAITIPSFADVAERVMPAVVSVTSTEVVSRSEMRGANPFDFFFRPIPEGREPSQFDERERVSGGSGFIITPDGYVLTNNHVVEGASRVEVRLSSTDKEYIANVVGSDPYTDLALLKIDSDDRFPVARLGNSDEIRIGDWALAIGNPLQLENTVTVGVISAKGRSLGLTTDSSFENLIQTDAAINFGNSGGPLLNVRGEVIGINTAIRGGGQNLGFAVPVNIAKQIYPRLRDEGRVVRGYLGINIDNIDTRERRAFGLESRDGVIVTNVADDQAAERAGVKAGDVIVAVDDEPIRNTRDLIDYVSYKKPGTTVGLTIIRDGKRMKLAATTGERPGLNASPLDDSRSRPGDDTREELGLVLREITDPRRSGLPDTATGLFVVDVRPLSPAADAGLTHGDIIVSVNGRDVARLSEFRRMVEDAETGDLLRIYVNRYTQDGTRLSRFAILEVP